MTLRRGTRLGSYEVLSPLGAGGMGEVYRARHVKLRREAAIKVLPSEFASDPERLRRFEREARAASALNHPAIVTIYDIGDHDGTVFIAMELVEGVTLRQRLEEGRLDPREVLRFARSIADGLARAHAAGVVHRDLKPENVMITRDGQVKILDFGLAKQLPAGVDAATALTTVTRMTRHGAVLGTVAYMSPEQASGGNVDHHSDQFSFGVVFYEMLCGERPFQGDSAATVVSAILRDPPPSPKRLQPQTPKGVERVVHRCLEKNPADRYPTTAELAEALRHGEASLLGRGEGLTVGRKAVAAVFTVLVIAGGLFAWLGIRDDLVRWMERDTIARVGELTEAGEIYDAFELAWGLEKKMPGDEEIRKLLERITIPLQIVTEPPGAEVHVRAYASPDDPWIRLGETPLRGVRHPYALAEWRITKEGFETFEGAPFGRPFAAFARGVTLDAVGSRPEAMVRVPGGPFALEGFPPVELDDYWLDRYEVTNRQFKEFVDAGGYGRDEYWTAPFVEAGREIPRAEAIARFVDATGQPGPAGWEVGTYGGGEEDLPVGGVSWYEAAAYCHWAGKSLPTLYHWSAAAFQDQLSDIVRVSNFGDEGPAPVGSHLGLGDFGTYDMAGNVKEWCHNVEADPDRYLLGGAWGEPSYLFRINQESSRPFSREPTHGFRCARYREPPAEELLAPVVARFAQASAVEATAVPDEIFAAYRRMYAYDRSGLESKVETIDESSPHWRRETVSFKAAYGGERILAHLLLPRNAEPPYQAVIWFPGDDVFAFPVGGGLASQYLFDFIPRSGRALVYPVYKGTYERHVPFSFAPNEWRDMMIMWSKDLGRTVDYLEERADIDAAKLGFYGFSAGAIYGPILTAIDERFGASVLLAGGRVFDVPPEMDPVNFAPRSRVPTLMINGRDDFLIRYDTAQDPLFRLLGAPEGEKRHARLEGGHIPSDRPALITEVLAWLDRHLGPIEAKGGG